jgi:hypothetical protein
MRSAANSTTNPASETCDPRQHRRDEQAFVEMIVLCLVLWGAWRLYRYWREQRGLARFRRRPPRT